MYRLALKMLFGDSAKYLMLVVGVFFATFLIAQQIAVFCGLIRWTASTLVNVPAPLWVVDSQVEQVNETNALRDTDVARVRSVDAVAWAMPLYAGMQRVRLADGRFKLVTLIGIDSTTFAGAPVKMLEGNIENLRLPNTVVIDDLAVTRLAKDKKDAATFVKAGDHFEINDLDAKVVGICDASMGFTGGPYLWTTYERALQYSPPSRKMLSAIIAAPAEGYSMDDVAAAIEAETGLRCYVNSGYGTSGRDFTTHTIWWYIRNTGIPISFGITVVVGFIVGVAISCQTFYAFVLENIKHLGALKAMGASNRLLCGMLVLQSLTVGFVGYGLGMLVTAGFAMSALKNEQPPFYMSWHVPVVVFAVILGICSLAAVLGIWRVSRFEPAMVFRA